MLLMLIIASSCEINSYQPVQNEERTDVIKQEIKEEPREGQITIIEVPRQKFTREQRIMLNKIKEQAQDVEFEEIQG